MADPAEIRRRYENDAARQGGAMPRSDAEEMRREASEQQAEDEEVPLVVNRRRSARVRALAPVDV